MAIFEFAVYAHCTLRVKIFIEIFSLTFEIHKIHEIKGPQKFSAIRYATE